MNFLTKEQQELNEKAKYFYLCKGNIKNKREIKYER